MDSQDTLFSPPKISVNDKKKKTKTSKKKKIRRSVILTSLVISLIVSFLMSSISFVAGFFIGSNDNVQEFFGIEDSQDNNTYTKTLKVNDTEEESAVISAVENNSPSVVSITVSANVPSIRQYSIGPFGIPYYDEDEGSSERTTVGSGSGFIVSSDGLIVTNKHVVSGYEDAEYTVFTTDADDELKAKVVAIDPTNDIALLDIEGDDFKALNLGDSDNLKVGQSVIAIGNAIGQFRNTVSKGVISGLQRDIIAGDSTGQESESLSNIIQTDAAINQGNSGGPLINMNGEVIGVNTARAQDGENIAFAIPIKEVVRAIESYRDNGEIVDDRAFLGVRYVLLDEQIKKENGLEIDEGALIIGENGQGAIVEGSPADEADLRLGDVIVKVDGVKVDFENTLSDLIGGKKAEEEVVIIINRDGNEIEKKITLAERPASEE